MRGALHIGLAEIRVGHALDILRAMPAESVHACVTSPPYYGLRNYGTDPVTWGDGWTGELGAEPTPEAYIGHLVEVFREVRRVLRRDGCLFVNIGDSYNSGAQFNGHRTKAGTTSLTEADRYTERRGGWAGHRPMVPGLKPKDLIGIPWMLAFALRSDGWWLRQENIWAKRAPMPESTRDRTTRATESVFHFAKSERYFYDADAVREEFADEREGRDGSRRSRERGRGGRGDGFTKPNGIDPSANGGRNLRNFWLLGPSQFPEAHFAVMPGRLAETCIKAATSEAGCCPSCAAPWVRVLEAAGEVSARGAERGVASQRVRQGTNGAFATGRFRVYQTRGWKPSCGCRPEAPVPCTVLDPFAGAGTTLLVADRLQRRSIGIELSPKYAEMARRRIERDAPLFASAVDDGTALEAAE